MTDATPKQWPDNIISGEIRYAPAQNYDGFYLADVMHGIPTIGSVSPTQPVTIRGQHVSVFNYPGQTEQIAAELVKRWNSHAALLSQVEALKGALTKCQKALAVIVDPAAIKSTSVMHAFAQAQEAETAARAALTAKTPTAGQLSDCQRDGGER